MKKKICCNKCGALLGYIIDSGTTAEGGYDVVVMTCPKCVKIIGPSETKEGNDGT